MHDSGVMGPGGGAADGAGPIRAFVRRHPRLHRALAGIRRWGDRTAARTHVKELWIYSRAGLRRVVAPDAGPRIRFLIYGQGRSGSSVLLTLIGSHPDVAYESEIFNRKVAARLIWPARYLRARASLGRRRAYGCKMKIYQMTDDQGIDDPHRFLLDLHEEGWKIVFLTRRDLFRKALSLVVAETRGRFLDRRSDGSGGVDSIHVDPSRLVTAMRERRAADEAERDALEGIPHVKVTYEDDLLDSHRHQETSDRVLAFLGLPSAPVETHYVRTSGARLMEYIENYEDVCRALAATELATYLPEPEAT